jgi:hypothetical protein
LYEVGPYELRRYFVLDDPQKQKELETICSRALSPIRNKKLKQEAFKDSEKPFVDQVWAMLLGTSGYDLNKAGKKLRKDALKAMREFKMPRSDIFEIAEGMREVGVKWEKVAERDDSVFLTDKNVKDIILARKTYVTRGKKQDAANEISI